MVLMFFLFAGIETEGNVGIGRINIAFRYVTQKGFYYETGNGFLFYRNNISDSTTYKYNNTYVSSYLKLGKRFYQNEPISPSISIKGEIIYSKDDNKYVMEESEFTYFLIPSFSFFITPFYNKKTNIKDFGFQLSLETAFANDSGENLLILPIPSLGFYFKWR